MKKVELVSKTLNVISLLKKEIAGKIQVRAKISYLEVPNDNNNDFYIPRSSSAFQIGQRNSIDLNNNNKNIRKDRGSMITMKNGKSNNFNMNSSISNINNNNSNVNTNNNTNNNINLTSNTINSRKNSKNNVKNNSKNNSKNLIKKNSSTSSFTNPYANNNNNNNNNDKKSIPRIPQVKRVSSLKRNSLKINKAQKIKDEGDDLDSSRIETLFDDDKLINIENVEKKLIDLINDFAERFKGKFEVNPEDYTMIGIEKLRDSMFELIETYYETFDKSVSLNCIMKSYLVSYSENYRVVNKKMNKLNELLETLSVKAEFSDKYYRDDNKRIMEVIDIVRKEIVIYKNIFDLKYSKKLEDKYKKEMICDTAKCKLIIFYLIENLPKYT